MNTTRSVARNTLFLSAAQGIRILLAFVLILYIANVYGAVWQGKFSILLAFLNIFQVLASFGLPRLITREVARDYAASNRYFWAGLLAQGSTTVIFMVAMVGIVALMPYPADTKTMLRLAVLALPLFTFYSVAGALLRAHENMQFLVFAEVLSSVAQLAVAVVLLAHGGGVMALAAIRIAGIGLAAATVVGSTIRLGYIRHPQIDLTFARTLLRRSYEFFGMAALDAFLQRLDVLVLSVVAGEAATGIYDAAFQLVKVLMTLVLSFTDAVYPAISRLYVQAKDRFSLATGKALQYGFVLLLPVAAGTTVLAPKIIALLYKRPAYGAAADILALLSWALLAYFAQILLTRTLMAGDRPGAAMRVEAVMVGVAVVLLPLLSSRVGGQGTAWGLMGVYGVGALLAWRASADYGLPFGLRCLGRPALAAAIMATALFFLPGISLWLAIPLGALLYGLFALGLGVFDSGDMQVLRALRK
ncbi:MAG: flippase [Chloroflexi bacterium]|nr:flippase [Chloroflexota bacterium]